MNDSSLHLLEYHTIHPLIFRLEKNFIEHAFCSDLTYQVNKTIEFSNLIQVMGVATEDNFYD